MLTQRRRERREKHFPFNTILLECMVDLVYQIVAGLVLISLRPLRLCVKHSLLLKSLRKKVRLFLAFIIR